MRNEIIFLADTGAKSESTDHAYAGMSRLKQPPFARLLQLRDIANRHGQRRIAILVLVGAGGIVENRAARAGFGDDVAHLDLQRVALQIDRLFLHGQPALLRRFVRFTFLVRHAVRLPRADRQLDGTLLLCNAQAGHQLLVDLRTGLDAAQDRHGVVDDRPFVIQRPRRRFLAGFRVDPRLRQELGERVAQAAMVEYDSRGSRKARERAAELLRQRVQPLAVIGAQVHQLFEIPALFLCHFPIIVRPAAVIVPAVFARLLFIRAAPCGALPAPCVPVGLCVPIAVHIKMIQRQHPAAFDAHFGADAPVLESLCLWGTAQAGGDGTGEAQCAV